MGTETLKLPLLLLLGLATGLAAETTFEHGPFGTVHEYRPAGGRPARHAVLFISGDGGWNKGVVDMARSLAGLGAVVAGVDITHYLKQLAASGDSCSDTAADLKSLGEEVVSRAALAAGSKPVLVGYSSGATLVYAALAQSPPDTFAGAISMGFCPDLPLRKPMCEGSGLRWETLPKGKGYNFLPEKRRMEPWIAFQGEIDQVCNPAKTREFVTATASGRLVSLPKVGHGFSVERNWLPQFKEAFLSLTR